MIFLLPIDTLGAGRVSMKCAYCVKTFKIPDDGFPKCRLTSYLREKLNLSEQPPKTKEKDRKTGMCRPICLYDYKTYCRCENCCKLCVSPFYELPPT